MRMQLLTTQVFLYEPPEQKHLSMKLYGENNSLLRNLEVFESVTSPVETEGATCNACLAY